MFYHATWSNKDCAPLIDPAWKQPFYNAIIAKARALGADVYAVGGIEDHVHLVASIPPSVLICKFIGQVKGNSSHFVNHKLDVDDHFSWQSEYGIVSFGQKQLDRVVKYVRNQRRHHHEDTIIPFLERDQE